MDQARIDESKVLIWMNEQIQTLEVLAPQCHSTCFLRWYIEYLWV